MKTNHLSQYYQINVNHLLSTRLDADISKEFFERVVFHGTAYNALSTIVSSQSTTFTVTGSYGTGKSTLATILAGLVDENPEVRQAVKKVIADQDLCDRLEDVFNTKYIVDKPWIVVKAVAGISSAVELLHRSIIEAVNAAKLWAYLEQKIDVNQKIETESQLLEWIITVFDCLKGRISGTLFILDEMGKLLENLARHSGNLHFFQDLSEKINRLSKPECPFIFIGILHQSFADYAKGLSHQIALEWSKIQGRYVDISYRISLDESIALVSKTIKKTDLKIPDDVEIKNQNLINQVQKFIGSRLLENSPKIKDYFYHALPLHPLAAVLLGAIAKSSFSQNERSIFSFLLSAEPYSLRKFFDASTLIDQHYSLVDLWDYLSYNLQHQILSAKEGHDWGIAEQSLTLVSQKINEEQESTAKLQLSYSLIKSIAMMNIFGKSLGIYPTEDLLRYAFNCTEEQNTLIASCLQQLVQWKILKFLHATQSYVVVNTSSVNVQELIQSRLQLLSEHQNYLDLIEYKENIVLAKRHYQETGIMRWMGKFLIHSVSQLDRFVATGLVVEKAAANFILLTEDTLVDSQLKKLSKAYPNCIFAKARNYKDIDNWARELFVLKQIKKDQMMLMFDSASVKEFESRYHHVYKQLDKYFNQAFDGSTWFYRGQKQVPTQLSIIASNIADDMFNQCPRVFNELVVRNEISSSAASGRRKLLEKMLESPEQENLGIEKFPSEKAIYLSCLKRLGLHHFNSATEQWEFVIPQEGKDQNLKLVKNLMDTGFEVIKKSKKMITLADVYREAKWEIEPFGLPQGILPIFAMALLQAKKDSFAFYDKDISQEYRFISEMDEEFINKLIKRPHEVAVKHVKTSTEKAEFLQILSQSIADIYNKNVEPQALQIARFIVSSVMKKSKWVKTSRDAEFFSPMTQKLRTTILKADDPFKLLFEDMSEIFATENSTETQLKSKIADFFLELDQAKPQLLNKFEKLLVTELGEFDDQLLAQAEVISKSAADWQLQKFAFHITNSKTESKQWLSNIITLLAQMPERDWSDDTLRKAFEKLPQYVQRFKQLAYFVKHNNPEEVENQKHLAIIISSSKGFEEFNRDVRITPETQQQVASIVDSFKKYLDEKGADLNNDIKAIALHELLKEYLAPAEEESDEQQHV